MPPEKTTFTARGRLSELIQEEISRHRLGELITAVREHQSRTSNKGISLQPHDEALYRRVRAQFADS